MSLWHPEGLTYRLPDDLGVLAIGERLVHGPAAKISQDVVLRDALGIDIPELLPHPLPELCQPHMRQANRRASAPTNAMDPTEPVPAGWRCTRASGSCSPACRRQVGAQPHQLGQRWLRDRTNNPCETEGSRLTVKAALSVTLEARPRRCGQSRPARPPREQRSRASGGRHDEPDRQPRHVACQPASHRPAPGFQRDLSRLLLTEVPYLNPHRTADPAPKPPGRPELVPAARQQKDSRHAIPAAARSGSVGPWPP